MSAPIIFRPFDKQIAFLQSTARIRGAFAGKRGGKTEVGAVEGVRSAHQQTDYIPNGIDPHIGIIIAPTADMLRRLSMAKFLAYAKPFILPGTKGHNQTRQELKLRSATRPGDPSIVYGISGEKPKRIEGIKAHWIWIDEVFQIKEQLFLECMARVSDTGGRIWCTGSLGVDYPNPKGHWAFKYFKSHPLDGSACFEWATGDNPYFSMTELLRLRDTLDPVTFRQMFTLSWDSPGTNLVYSDFSDVNVITGYTYDPALPTYIAVDWGFAHPMAVGFFQYNPATGIVVQFDEVVGSRLTLDMLWERITAKIDQHKMRVTEWYCDIAGNQEREQTGYSNVKWFKDQKNITFKFRTSAVTYGVTIVRSFVKDGAARRRFLIVGPNCPKSVDGMRNYSYQEKKGHIVNENPIKRDDDACDMIRYFFVNRLDPSKADGSMAELNRWGKTW